MSHPAQRALAGSSWPHSTTGTTATQRDAQTHGARMRRIVVCTNLTLDGVMQAPARPDEDPRGGFAHGGWATPYAAMTEAGEYFGSADALLFGRRTYEDFARVWPARTDNPFTPWLNGVTKHVASATLRDPLSWVNSRVLQGDARDAVAELRAGAGRDILVLGSGQLVRSLMTRKLIDVFVLLIHPLVLGSGLRLFPESGPATPLRLTSSKPTASGVVMATYEPATA